MQPNGPTNSPSDGTGVGRIARQLVRDSEFRASKRLKELLIYLCDHADSTPDHPVSQVQIAKDVMGLSDDFDPVADAHVRIEIGRLRTALTVYFADPRKAQGGKIEIPKGSYKPVLGQNPMRITIAEKPHDAIKVLATFGSNYGDCGEIVDLVETGVRFHCHNSPLVSTGVMSFVIKSGLDRDRALTEAERLNAQVSVHSSFVHNDTDFRVFTEVRDVRSGVTKWCHRYVLNIDGTPIGELARQFARSIATVLADPILGVAPGVALTLTHDVALEAVLNAYNFMASQKLGTVAKTVEGLDCFSRTGQTAPAVQGLLAELRRVAGRLRIQGEQGPPEHYLEMAEEALALDVNDITCRMALGYAKLNAGQTRSAFKIGKGILELSPPVSLLHKARMLVALASNDTNSELQPAKAEIGSDGFYMKEFATLIPKIRAGDLTEADHILSSSLYGNVFWLHVFQAAVCAESGNLERAVYSGARVKKLIPGMEHMIAPLVTGFFPRENESHYILSGLRKSGLDLDL